MIKSLFVTVSDRMFFPGTLSTINSILHFHPDASIAVVSGEGDPLTPPQIKCLERSKQVTILPAGHFMQKGRYLGPWELKAYAVCDLANEADVIIGVDSDCILCSPVDDVIRKVHRMGGISGGKDGDGASYGREYAVYGMKTPACNTNYMSTSLYFLAVTDENLKLLQKWADCTGKACYNGRGDYPGHGDQGQLNAVMFAMGLSNSVMLLENPLWSQHWTYWDSIIDYDGSKFINRSAANTRQRSFHCGGTEKFWAKQHRDKILSDHPLQTYPYVWYLAMLWFGQCSWWDVDPCQWLPLESHHLVDDLVRFAPQIFSVMPTAREKWSSISDSMLDRMTAGVNRAMSLGGGSMTDTIELVKSNPGIHRYVEVGSYHGGSILTLALRFLNRDIDFYSVESFMGNMNGTMDGHPLPSRSRYELNHRRFPTTRIAAVPGVSKYAAENFDKKSIDCIFIDACHDTDAVLQDIDTWRSRVRPGGIIAGDDYTWESVQAAVKRRFSDYHVTPSGHVWWTRV